MSDLNIQGLDVSRETMGALKHFAALVEKWTGKINLVSGSDTTQIWSRHIIDSAQMMCHVNESPKMWVDLGSGGGFPGIVASIISKETYPETKFTLIESDQRKATFLRTAIRECALDATVIAKRIDEAPEQNADVISARALIALPDMMPFLARHMNPTGEALLHKGRRFAVEIADARAANWDFDLREYPSMTDPEARILSLKRIKRA